MMPARTRYWTPHAIYDVVKVKRGLILETLLYRELAPERRQDGSDGETRALEEQRLAKLANRFGSMWALLATQQTADAHRRSRAELDEWLWQGLLGLGMPVAQLQVIDGLAYPVLMCGGEKGVPVVSSDWGKMTTQDKAFGDGRGNRRSPFGLLQDFLNRAGGPRWGLAFDGRTLRLARTSDQLGHAPYIEVSLAAVAQSSHVGRNLWALQRVAGREAFLVTGKGASRLETWRKKGLDERARARQSLRDNVQRAIVSLGNGLLIHPANHTFRELIATGELSPRQVHRALLTLVYRVIFILTCEARGHLPVTTASAAAREAYSEGYALTDLGQRAPRPDDAQHSNLWSRMREVFRGLVAGNGELGLPVLGGLFDAHEAAAIDAADVECDNASVQQAMTALTHRVAGESKAAMVINWSDLDTDEFGGIYESLLGAEPILSEDGRSLRFEITPASSARKASGSYYTPPALARLLVEKTLRPRLDAFAKLPAAQREKALLGLTCLDPACGSGHLLLTVARMISECLLDSRREQGTADDQDDVAAAQATRDVVRHCLFGVDSNALAVDITRIALWLECMGTGQALPFLSHHILHGDSLLSLKSVDDLQRGLPDMAFNRISRNEGGKTPDPKSDKILDELARKRLDIANRLQRKKYVWNQSPVLKEKADEASEKFRKMAKIDDRTAEQVLTKAVKHKEWSSQLIASPTVQGFRVWITAFLAPKTAQTETSFPTSEDLASAVEGRPLRVEVADLVEEFLDSLPAPPIFWHDQFSEAMAQGGFDVVVSNPPWSQMVLKKQEFFALRDPLVARARHASERNIMIQERFLEAPESSLGARVGRDFIQAGHRASALGHFVRSASLFKMSAKGKTSTYRLFSELSLSLMSREKGRAGVLVPSGILCESHSSEILQKIVKTGLEEVSEFENTRTDYGEQRRFFLDVDTRFRFALLVMGSTENTRMTAALRTTRDVEDSRRQVNFSGSDLQIFSAGSGNMPLLKSAEDFRIAMDVHRRVNNSNFWYRKGGRRQGGLNFYSMLNMSGASGRFSSTFKKDYVPLMEPKMVHQYLDLWQYYDHKKKSFFDRPDHRNPDPSLSKKADPEPRYWVKRDEVLSFVEKYKIQTPYFLVYRKISGSTNQRSCICSLVPRFGLNDALAAVVLNNPSSENNFTLLALLNSLVFDYLVRQKISGMSLNHFILKQTPLPNPDVLLPEAREFLASRAARLSASSPRLADMMSQATGRTLPLLSADARRIIRAEIDAYVAALYGLSRKDLCFVLEPTGPDAMGRGYPSETFAALARAERNPKLGFGRYLTHDLTLQAWDELVAQRRLPDPVGS